MTYNADLTWTDLSRDTQNASRNAINVLTQGLTAYDEWQSFRNARTNAQIATALGRAESEVADMDSAYAALLALYNYANNQTPTQSDYLFSLRKFS